MPISNYLGQGKKQFGLGFKPQAKARPAQKLSPLKKRAPGANKGTPMPQVPGMERMPGIIDDMGGGGMTPDPMLRLPQTPLPGLNRQAPVSNPDQMYGIMPVPPEGNPFGKRKVQ